jgi:nitrous oxide reductase
MDEKQLGNLKVLTAQNVLTTQESSVQTTKIEIEQNAKRLKNAKETLALIEEANGKNSQAYKDQLLAVTKLEQDSQIQKVEFEKSQATYAIEKAQNQINNRIEEETQ